MEINSPISMHDPLSSSGPPLIPNVTKLPPHQMQEIVHSYYGEPEGEAEDPDAMLSEGEIVAKIGKLAYQAAQFGPELLDLCLQVVKAVRMSMLINQQPVPRGLPVPLGMDSQGPMPPEPLTAPQLMPSSPPPGLEQDPAFLTRK